LAAHPLVSGEWRLINVHDLEPGAHKMIAFELLLKWLNQVTDDVLLANLAIVDRFKGLGHGHCNFFFLLNKNYYI